MSATFNNVYSLKDNISNNWLQIAADGTIQRTSPDNRLSSCDRFSSYFGFGPAGVHTIMERVRELAYIDIAKLARPIRGDLEAIHTRNFQVLDRTKINEAREVLHQMHKVLEHLNEVETAITERYYGFCSRCIYAIASLLSSIASILCCCFQSCRYSRLESWVQPYLSKKMFDSIYRHRLEPFMKEQQVWKAVDDKQSEYVLKLRIDWDKLSLYLCKGEDSRIGFVEFDYKEPNKTLHITQYSILTNYQREKVFVTHFFNKFFEMLSKQIISGSQCQIKQEKSQEKLSFAAVPINERITITNAKVPRVKTLKALNQHLKDAYEDGVIGGYVLPSAMFNAASTLGSAI